MTNLMAYKTEYKRHIYGLKIYFFKSLTGTIQGCRENVPRETPDHAVAPFVVR